MQELMYSKKLLLGSDFFHQLCSVPSLKNIECIWKVFLRVLLRRGKVWFNFLLLFHKLSSKHPLHIRIENLKTKDCLFPAPDNWGFFQLPDDWNVSHSIFFPTVAMSLKGVVVKRELTGRRNIPVSAKSITFPSHSTYVSISHTCQNRFSSFG